MAEKDKQNSKFLANKIDIITNSSDEMLKVKRDIEV